MLDSLGHRACPVCGCSDDSHERFAERLDTAQLGALAYSSRKDPEYMNLRMVVCPDCDLLYAPRVPSTSFLAHAYADTGYDNVDEAQYAAVGYAEALRERLPLLPDMSSALEVGSGNGALLQKLRRLGFAQVTGVEPSHAAAGTAPDDVRAFIRVESFNPALLPGRHFSLVIANQTLEHIADPFGFMVAARGLLKPGGAIMIVSHNYRHWLARALGARSPIIDIEHLQIFSPASLEFALRKAGFVDMRIDAFSNRYPIHYWFRLMPVPRSLKHRLHDWLRQGAGAALGQMALRARVGNMLAWASVPR